MKATARSLHTLLAVGLSLGCPAEKAKEAPPPKPAPPVAAEPPPAPSPPEPIADPACMAAWNLEGEAKTVTAGSRTFERKGTRLSETSSDEDELTVLGVLANVKEDTAENLRNIDQFLAFWKASNVEAILVAGDIGEKAPQIQRVLEKLAATKLPVFTIIGNLESRAEYGTALAAVAAAHPNVVDMTQVRLALLDDVAIVSVPGYHNKVYIHAEDGCEFGPGDLDATKPIIAAAGGKTVVLLSHSPPQQDGPEAIDRTLEQANVGDPALRKLIDETGVRFGVFPNIHEAGGRATDLDGKKLVSPDQWADSLLLNSGAADSVAWKMNDGTESVGMAAVLKIKGREASFQIHRAVAGGTKPGKKK